MSATKNLMPMVGKVFFRLIVLSPTTKRSPSGTVIYACRCECGKVKEVDGVQLRRGGVKSCGCLGAEYLASAKTGALTHGATVNKVQLPAYKTWIAMRRRCSDSSAKDFAYYGGKGITVCAEWQDFAKFYADMGDRPLNYSLDRIDSSKNYCAINCRWVTHLTQMNNTTRNRKVSYKGETYTVSEWARILNIPRARLSARLNGLGWPIEKVFEGDKYEHHN